MSPIIALPRVTRHHPLRVTALPEALPFALAAAVYPPALLVLLLLTGGPRPRPLVGAYFAGAALVTAGAGLVGLAVADGARLTVQHSRHASAITYIALGLLLLPVAAWAWRRGRRPARERAPGRIAEWSRRAASSRQWAFVLGLLMYLPSPLYLLAIKAIADSGDSSASNVLAVFVCAICVLLFVEVPLVALYLRPAAVAGGLRRVHDWLVRNSWNLAAGLALVGAVYALVKGVAALD
jgi:Sap, sulfolipid-1-addressing protein